VSSERPDCAVLQDLITAERLTSYLGATEGNLQSAIALYDWNTLASAAVLATTAMVEVVVRNSLDRSLLTWAARRHDGRDWLDVAPLDGLGREDIRKARDRATRLEPYRAIRGKVIAELSFGFWRYLIASRYLTALWIPGGHAAFSFGPRDLRTRRAEVERRMKNQLLVRNRAAHHEPIHRRDLMRDFDDAVTLMSWVHPEAAAWARRRSQLPQLAITRSTLRPDV
jgi:hypothetical protein